MRSGGIQADLGFRQHMVAAVSDGVGAGVGLWEGVEMMPRRGRKRDGQRDTKRPREER